MFWSRNKKKKTIQLHTLVVLYKIGVQWGYTLHGHVFVMLNLETNAYEHDAVFRSIEGRWKAHFKFQRVGHTQF